LAFHSGRDHSPPSSAEVEEWVELYLHSPNASSWRDAQLGGAQGPSLLRYQYVANYDDSHEDLEALTDRFLAT
jgi:hypothetical protein